MLKKVTRGHRHPIAHSYETHVHFYADDQTVYVTPILAVLFTSDQTDPLALLDTDTKQDPEPGSLQRFIFRGLTVSNGSERCSSSRISNKEV